MPKIISYHHLKNNNMRLSTINKKVFINISLYDQLRRWLQQWPNVGKKRGKTEEFKTPESLTILILTSLNGLFTGCKKKENLLVYYLHLIIVAVDWVAT